MSKKEKTIEKSIEPYPTWHYIADNDLPAPNSDVILATTAGKTYEGYMQVHNIKESHLDSDGKRIYPEYPSGGRWYRYKFKDYITNDEVVAWCHKPIGPIAKR